MTNTTGKSNYRKWSFRFLIYLIVLNIFVAYDVSQGEFDGWRMILLSVLTLGLWIGGIVLTAKSHLANEDRDFQYYASLWGFAIYTVVNFGIQFFTWAARVVTE